MKWLALFIVLMVTLSLNAENIDSDNDSIEQAEKHYLKGKEYSLGGDYEKANEEFKKAEEILAEEILTDASQDVSVHSADKDEQEARSRGVNALISSRVAIPAGNFKENIEAYLELSEAMPDNVNIHYNLAVEYIKGLHYWDAVQELNQVIRLDPKDKDAFYNLAVLNEIYLNDKKTAAKYYKKYLSIGLKTKDKRLVQDWIDVLESKR